jgi:hypothetical protein
VPSNIALSIWYVTSGSPAFTYTSFLVFYTFSDTLYAYITDISDTLWQCPMNESTGAFSGACTALTNSTSFINTNVMGFYTVGGIVYAYIGDGSHQIWQCPMNETGGFADTCTALTGFDHAVSATFQTS